jgi:hypothetical protein
MVRNTVPANTVSLPHNIGNRLGTTVSDERILPVLYSPVISSTPRTPTASWAKNVPVSEVEMAVAPGSNPVVSLAVMAANIAPSPIITTTAISRVATVDRRERNLVHSDNRTRAWVTRSPRHRCAGGLAQLHRVAADAAGGADDQHPLLRLESPGIEGLHSGAAGDPDDRRLLERDVRRLVGELVPAGRGVLGEGATAHPEHLVAHAEPGHRGPGRDDRAGDIDAGHPILRPAEPEPDDPHQIRGARHHVPGPRIQTCRVHAEQHLMVGDLGSVDPRRPEHLDRAVAVLHDRPHLDPRRRLVRNGGRQALAGKSHDRFPFKR